MDFKTLKLLRGWFKWADLSDKLAPNEHDMHQRMRKELTDETQDLFHTMTQPHMVKVAPILVAEAIEECHQSMVATSGLKLEEIANYLTAKLDPEWVSYTVNFENGNFKNGSSDLSGLLKIIELGGTVNSHIDITIQHGDVDDAKTLTVIGRTRCHLRHVYHRLYLRCVKADGAGINLHMALNELIKKSVEV